MLYRLGGRPTGREIARRLGISFGTCSYFDRTRPNWEVAIRWGGAEAPARDTPQTLNPAEAIRRTGKLTAFRLMQDAGVSIPEFTTNQHEAREWGTRYLGRTTNDRAGRGITVYGAGDAPLHHPLYVRFIPNDREYRLHVVRGVVVSTQRKYLERPELDDGGIIKNHDHGYVFKTPERELHDSRKQAAIKAVEALGLDFGAVDLIVDQEGKEYVLEVNSAPALSPKRIEQYVEALRPLLQPRA